MAKLLCRKHEYQPQFHSVYGNANVMQTLFVSDMEIVTLLHSYSKVSHEIETACREMF